MTPGSRSWPSSSCATRCATLLLADVDVDALGYQSIGDSATGFEHFLDYGLLTDDKTLDPTA